jgi:hypothetical protein
MHITQQFPAVSYRVPVGSVDIGVRMHTPNFSLRLRLQHISSEEKKIRFRKGIFHTQIKCVLPAVIVANNVKEKWVLLFEGR